MVAVNCWGTALWRFGPSLFVTKKRMGKNLIKKQKTNYSHMRLKKRGKFKNS